MIKSFKDKRTQDFWQSGKAKHLPSEILTRALLKLEVLDYAYQLEDLRSPPSNHLEKLSGDLSGFYSIRINQKWRIIFTFEQGNAYEVSILDYH
ncbi:plasmid maintenance system killer protein [Helicobacter sp. MIT 00-7814]|uniref:type II toxin-antitoxin system RelE/ParE family toxin n=1 Tax=unclassified Helicobacter TaxID=2593540 RepID=UPI000E1F7AAF|nr:MULTISPECIES: type II toxin-antitoxin system RelE/ParE family toxin [unclassified Helicobacter]RDU52597.1 plasmid maintenance system killer protein [Helicobacter sp. MIT 99-10781]RDU52864.1 plasmid maintenance system killer protein [Helicobacter sp. MIT 00-7814]